MARNVYFSQKVNTETWLYEDLTIEALRIYGRDVYYLPRTVVTRDMILNEDVESQFNDAYTIEMYIEDNEGFGGEGNLMQKFGLEIRDEVTLIVARRTWEKLVGWWNNSIGNRPNEGDLIYIPMTKSFFEISFVEHEQPFYQLNNLVVYKLQCRLFEYAAEDFDTGVPEIDQIETEHAQVLHMVISDLTGKIAIGDVLYQAIRRNENGVPVQYIKGKVIDQKEITTTDYDIYLTDVEAVTIDGYQLDRREFITSTANVKTTYLIDTVTNATPAISAQIVTIYDVGSIVDGVFSNDTSAQNWEFEQDAGQFIDFSETNPFGDPNVQPTIVQKTIYTLDSTNYLANIDSTLITIDQQK